MTMVGVYRFAAQTLQPVIAHDGRAPIRFRRVVEPGERPSCNFIDFSLIPPGAEIGVHTHADDNEEIYIVLEGHGRMSLDGADITIGPGDVVVNRPAGTHGLTNDGPDDLKLVVIEVPTQRATSLTPPSPLDPSRDDSARRPVGPR